MLHHPTEQRQIHLSSHLTPAIIVSVVILRVHCTQLKASLHVRRLLYAVGDVVDMAFPKKSSAEVDEVTERLPCSSCCLVEDRVGSRIRDEADLAYEPSDPWNGVCRRRTECCGLVHRQTLSCWQFLIRSRQPRHQCLTSGPFRHTLHDLLWVVSSDLSLVDRNIFMTVIAFDETVSILHVKSFYVPRTRQFVSLLRLPKPPCTFWRLLLAVLF